jgi:3-oxoacyl-[acyl-carrier protein] reductase
MDLEIKDKLFIVTGATSGLGKGVAIALLNDGAEVIAVARDSVKLKDLSIEFPGQVEELKGDITEVETIQRLFESIGKRYLNGILVNAGGPPAKSFLETELSDWDDAYQKILKWKVALTKTFLPVFLAQQYGRFVFIESVSVKQPIRNLVLSTSLRSAVVGFVKTVSQEVAAQGITLNILAPGFHNTPAAHRLFVKRAAVEGISIEDARTSYEREIPVNRMGDTGEFGMLGAWLLSPHSGYITGQTITVDGGAVRGIFG